MDSVSPPKKKVSRSRGKRPGEHRVTARLRELRKEKGQAHSSDESESEGEDEPGVVVLHQLFQRKVTLYPDNTVVKSGCRIALGEAAALRTAAEAGIPVPRVHDAKGLPDELGHIRMDYVPGESLDKLWRDMTVEAKKDVARQLREILTKMRAIEPPAGYIGACDGTGIRDTRHYFTYNNPACADEQAFNEYLLSSLVEHTPSLVREAFARRLRTHHRVVLTHCDLAPRNIIIENGKISGIVDWEDGGWYPEYWEFIKFFQRPAEKGWKEYAEDIFPEVYPDDLVVFFAMFHWQEK